jgi:hypothetical protein
MLVNPICTNRVRWFLRFVRPLINGGQAQRCDALHDSLAIAEEDG